MNFFKALFGGKEVNKEEKRKEDEARQFNVLKYDGVAALKSGRPSFAIDCFNHALELKEDLEIRDYLSQAFIQTGELLNAYEELKKLSEVEPENIQILIRMANVAYMMENYSAMADSCEKAMMIDNGVSIVHLLYAKACLGQGDSVNALAMLTKSIMLDGKNFDAYLLRAELLIESGELEDAEKDVDLLLENVIQEEVFLLQVKLEKAKGKQEKAVEICSKVIEMNPFSIDAFKERALLRKELGDLKGAEEDEERVSEMENNDQLPKE